MSNLYKLNKPIVIYDIEATCDENMKKKNSELIEIGAVKVFNGEIIDKFSCLIKPIKHPILTTYCKNLCKISQEDINNAEDPKTVIKRFIEWSQGSILASWGDFDWEILTKEAVKHNLIAKSDSPIHHSIVNIKKVYFISKRKREHYSLNEVLTKEKIIFEGQQHRAYNDAYNTYKVYRANRERMDYIISKIYTRAVR
jgi:inhibitor of KinA sporulation pathway (predicted exonuclease)